MRRSVLVSLFAAAHDVRALTLRSWTDATALATELVAGLTTPEKVSLAYGVGEFSGVCVGNLPAISRVGLPSICMNDGPAGIRAVDLVSGFPAGITAAATWNKDLIRQRGQAIAEEFRTKGAHVYLGPAMDVMRAPEAGRLWESFGADPYLSGEATYATIVGVQSVGVQAVAKHAIGNNQEMFRFTESSVIDQRTLMENYNRINGTYACVDPAILGGSGILKGYGGHKGYVVSDWGATHGDAAKLAQAGLDIEMPGTWILIGGGVYSGGLSEAVSSGAVSNATLNNMVVRTLTPYYMLGQDSDFPTTNFNVNGDKGNQHVNARSDAHTAVIRQIANAAAVLLKNTNNALPLSTSSPPRKMAVVGLDAAPADGCTLNACDDGTLSVGWGSGTNSLAYLVAPITAIQTQITAGGNKTKLVSSITNDRKAAVAAAKGADVAIVFVNADSGEYQPIPVAWSTGDRTDNNLWNDGDALITAVAAACKNTIVVIHTVGPTLVDAWIDHENVTAVVMASLPGEQSGPSIVDVLYGVINPSGRLPYTIAKKSSDWKTHTLEHTLDLSPTITYSEGLFTDYMYFDQHDIAPRFEFGFGLSYHFAVVYSGLSITTTGTNAYVVTVSVKNTGSRTGTEIAQLYLGFPSGVGEPPKLLRGFEAVPLEPGQTQAVSFPLITKDISIWDSVEGAMVRPSGKFMVYVGSSSRNIALTGTI